MNSLELELKKCELSLAEKKIRLTAKRRIREQRGSELRAEFERAIAELDYDVEMAELEVQRWELYVKSAKEDADQGYES